MAAVGALRPHLVAMAARAAALDESAQFPAEDVEVLRRCQLPEAPLPASRGGEGAGTEPGGTDTIFELLRLLGTANLSLGRLFEAHVNAVRLVTRFGTAEQLDRVGRACRGGALFGLWVTDPPNRPLTIEDGILRGAKGPSSGAGHLRHALVTVAQGHHTSMALIELTGHEPVEPVGDRLHGMRASANGTIALDGVPLPDHALVGGRGDYLREPDFSTGAWRGSAVALGGLEALVESTRQQLVARGHAQLPLQQARFGEMLIGLGTCRLWTRHAATIAEDGTVPIPDQVAIVNMARIAVEQACLDVMRHAQRALGLGALLRPNPVERLLRDLATYLRQPAPDAVLTEAALHHLCPP